MEEPKEREMEKESIQKEQFRVGRGLTNITTGYIILFHRKFQNLISPDGPSYFAKYRKKENRDECQSCSRREAAAKNPMFEKTGGDVEPGLCSRPRQKKSK